MACDIASVFHYQPLHLSRMGRQYGYSPGDFPVTEHVSDRLVRLPFYNSMAEEELQRIVEAIISVRLPSEQGA
jgi:dTDP-4-amino-4,6-dideoxygalactose transaminase